MMFIELIKKDIQVKNEVTSKAKWSKVLSILAKLVLIGCFIALECFIFTSLDKKITEYSSYGTLDFLILILFITMIVDIFAGMVKARKLLFNKSDNEVILPLPISNGEIVFSKILYVFLNEILTHLVISVPILICFGARRLFIPYFYVFCIVYPILISLFSIGIVLIFAVIYEFIYKLIKTSDLIQFIIACTLVIGLCFAYQIVLTLFMNALDDSSIGGVFSSDFINSLHNLIKVFVPVYYLLVSVIEGTAVFSNVCIYLGSVLLSLTIGSLLASSVFAKLSKNSVDFSLKKKKEKKTKIMSPFKAMLKKEWNLLFKDSAYTFSYTSLLIMCPFLAYVVISTLNSILYSKLNIFLSFYPELINGINIGLILLFSSVINASGSLSISKEKRGILLIKSIPVSPFVQILAKLIIPTLLSSISLIITLIVLFASSSISSIAFFVSLLIGLCLILFSNIFGIYFDMHDRSEAKIKLSSLNAILSLALPLFILFLHLLMTFNSVSSLYIYLVICGFSLLLLLPCFIRFKTRLVNAFNRMEVN